MSNQQQITVYPTNNPAYDLQNVRDAVANVQEGGTVLLKSHAEGAPPDVITPFNFGGDEKANSVKVTKSVHIRGEKVKDTDREWHDPQGWAAGVAEGCGTTIVGGWHVFDIDMAAGTQPPPGVPPGVAIDDIRFAEFYRMAVRITSSFGTSRVRGCSFANYKPSAHGSPKGAFPIVADPMREKAPLDPSRLSGELFLTNNYFGEPPAPSMNNASHVSNCDLTLLEFKHNRIADAHFVGFAVYGNSGHTKIIENNVTKNSTYANPAGTITMGVAISCGMTPGSPKNGDGSFTIRGNTIAVGASESFGIIALRFGQPAGGTPSVIRDNVITMGPGTTPDSRAAIALLGAGWWKMRCAQNTIVNGAGVASGAAAAPFGIIVSTEKLPFVVGTVTVPSPSLTEISSNNLDGFVPSRSHLYVAQAVYGAEVKDNSFGAVCPTPPNAGDPWLLGGLPQQTLKAAMWWQGDHGTIAGNHFFGETPGWEDAPHIGCIYMDTSAGDNTIEYYADEAPFQIVAGTGYDENQIFDASGTKSTNTFSPLYSKAPVPA